MKILLYGIITEENFGGPSLLHGAVQLIREIYNDAEIICYQSNKINETAVSDMDFFVLHNPYKSTGRFLIDGIKYKFGIKPKNEKQAAFLNDIKTSDIVANLFGICFCANFNTKKTGRLKSIKSVVGKFAISFIAKIYGVKTVKCPASYGPIQSQENCIQARFAANRIFDEMYARENESRRQMVEQAGISKNILTSPDLANLMPYNRSEDSGDKYISISVSYQIIKQWDSKEAYKVCIANLIKYIKDNLKLKVYLIPNEVLSNTKYHDIHVAKEIHLLLDNSPDVIIPDIKNMSSIEIKSLIAGSQVLIASRYHSCVAGLSSGVPTLVLGWHYKYDELLQLYGQDRWLISCDNCTSDKLINMFETFWLESKKERENIKEKYKEVHKKLIEIGKIMFNK